MKRFKIKRFWYVTRDRLGRIREWVRIGKSIKLDKKKKSKNKVKPGYGFRGDIK